MTRFSISLPPDLNDWLVASAEAEGRSKNRQIEHYLRLYRDIISAHASGLTRPGYSLEDEQWQALKRTPSNSLAHKGKKYTIAERAEE